MKENNRGRIAVGLATCSVLVGTAAAFIFWRSRRQANLATEQRAENAKDDETAPPSPNIERAQTEGAAGTVAFKARDFESAVKHYTAALDFSANGSPESCILLSNRAAAKERLGDSAGVIDDTSRVLEVDFRHAKCLQRRARALEASDRPREALQDCAMLATLEMVQQHREPSEQLNVKMDQLMHAVGARDAKEIFAERLKHCRGMEFFPPKSFVTAYHYAFARDAAAIRVEKNAPTPQSELSRLRAAVQGGGTAAARLELGRLLKRQRNFVEAVAEFSKASSDTGATPETLASALNECGTAQHLCGDLVRARQTLERALELRPGSVNTLVKLAGLAAENNEVEMSEHRFAEAESLLSNASVDEKADFHLHRALASMIANKLEPALSDLELACDTVPDFAMAVLQLGICHFRRGNAPKALALLAKACTLAPELPEAHVYHGEILLSQGDLEGAKAKFEVASKTDPGSVMPYINRATLELNQGSIGTARELLDTAITVDPTCELTYVHLGALYQQTGNLSEAVSAYERAVELSKTRLDLEESAALLALSKAQANAQEQLAMRQD